MTLRTETTVCFDTQGVMFVIISNFNIYNSLWLFCTVQEKWSIALVWFFVSILLIAVCKNILVFAWWHLVYPVCLTWSHSHLLCFHVATMFNSSKQLYQNYVKKEKKKNTSLQLYFYRCGPSLCRAIFSSAELKIRGYNNLMRVHIKCSCLFLCVKHEGVCHSVFP